jgi:16S rRNA (guanine527-N7)-methyltransferase
VFSLNKELIKKETGFDLNSESIKKIETYLEILIEDNKLYNLTRITQEDEVLYKHLIDSLHFIKTLDFNEIDSLVDIGTGGGFPGVVFAIISGIKTTLIETVNKKCIFLNKVKNELELKNLEVINDRVEEYGRKNREKFSIAVSRAFSSVSYCMETHFPMVKQDGKIILMDGPSFEFRDEIKKCHTSWR